MLACVQTSPISFVARRRLHAGNPVPDRKNTSERSFARQKEKRLSSDNEAHITYSFSAHYDV